MGWLIVHIMWGILVVVLAASHWQVYNERYNSLNFGWFMPLWGGAIFLTVVEVLYIGSHFMTINVDLNWLGI